jgi:hypothetical protein
VHEVVPAIHVEDPQDGVALGAVSGREARAVEEPGDTGNHEREADHQRIELGWRAFFHADLLTVVPIISRGSP